VVPPGVWGGVIIAWSHKNVTKSMKILGENRWGTGKRGKRSGNEKPQVG